MFRHTVVYLTCLHETGHALGLPHTRSFADIMYSFEYGGNIVEYFTRYRRKLQNRDDIQNVSGLSTEDERRLLAIYNTNGTGSAAENRGAALLASGPRTARSKAKHAGLKPSNTRRRSQALCTASSDRFFTIS